MTIEESRKDGAIWLCIEGRVDINGGPELQKSILLAFQKGMTVVLDFEKVEYLSSAGLRALLLGQKTANSKGGVMKLVHVDSSVMEVLGLTGFDDILTIE